VSARRPRKCGGAHYEVFTMRRPTDRSEIIVRTWIVSNNHGQLKTTYPDRDVADVLDRCVAALTERLREEFHEERRQLIDEIRTRLW
jgi:hypothetical protein